MTKDSGTLNSRATRDVPIGDKRSLRRTVITVVIFSVITAVQMGGAITSCDDTIMGGPGDPTAGAIWRNWQYELLDVGPWPARSPMINAPYSERIWDTPLITAQALFTPMWLFAAATNHVCGWNIMIFLGLTLSGLSMFGLVRWLSGNYVASLVAGYAYAYSPFHIVKSGHFAYIHSWPLVLSLWALLRLWRRPSPRNGVILGISLGVLIYFDAYYMLLGPVQTFGALLCATVVTVSNGWRYFKPRLKALFVGAVAAVIVSLPALLILANTSEETRAQLSRIRGTQSSEASFREIAVYTARPAEFLIPSIFHPLVTDEVEDLARKNMHGSNPSEQSLFLGFVVVALSIVGVWKAPKTFRNTDDSGIDDSSVDGERLMVPASMLIGAVIIGMAFSGPPRWSFRGFTVLGPSGAVALIIPYWRVFARFFLVVHGSLVALAGIGLHSLTRNFSKNRQLLVSGVMLVLIAFEFMTWPPREEWSYEETPKEYFWLARQSAVDIVAEYPMQDPPHPPAYDYLSYQPVHGKKLFNYAIFGGPQQPLKEGLKAPGDPQTLSILRSLGVDAVLTHTNYARSFTPAEAPEGLELAASFKDAGAYLIQDGPAAQYALGIEEGFNLAEFRGWKSFRWMSHRGELKVWRLGGDLPLVRVRFVTSSYEQPRELRIHQSGKEILVTTVDVRPKTLELLVIPETPFELRVSPPAMLEPGPERRFLSISLSDFEVLPPEEPAT